MQNDTKLNRIGKIFIYLTDEFDICLIAIKLALISNSLDLMLLCKLNSMVEIEGILIVINVN